MPQTHVQQLKLLAAGIFLLWSIGVVVLPALQHEMAAGSTFFAGATWVITVFYQLMHTVLFLYALSIFPRTLRSPHVSIVEIALYPYVLIMLGISLYYLFFV